MSLEARKDVPTSAQKGRILSAVWSLSTSIEGRFRRSEVLKKVPSFVRALVSLLTQGPPGTLSETPSILEFLEQGSPLDNRQFPAPRTPEPAVWSN